MSPRNESVDWEWLMDPWLRTVAVGDDQPCKNVKHRVQAPDCSIGR